MSKMNETGAHKALVAAAALRTAPSYTWTPDAQVMTSADIRYRAIEARAIHACGLAGITLPGEPL